MDPAPAQPSDPVGDALEVALEVALAALSDATLEAIEAHDDFRRAKRRWDQARAALVACYRDTGLLAVQGEYPVGLPVLLPQGDPGNPVEEDDHDPIGTESETETESDEPYLDEPADDAPEVVTRPPETSAKRMADFAAERATAAAGGGPGQGKGGGRPASTRLSRNEQQVLERTIANGGNYSAVAKELSQRTGNVGVTLERIGKKGYLPIDLIAKLPARFAKYTGV